MSLGWDCGIHRSLGQLVNTCAPLSSIKVGRAHVLGHFRRIAAAPWRQHNSPVVASVRPLDPCGLPFHFGSAFVIQKPNRARRHSDLVRNPSGCPLTFVPLAGKLEVGHLAASPALGRPTVAARRCIA